MQISNLKNTETIYNKRTATNILWEYIKKI